MVIVVDDHDRENEGDIVFAGDAASPEKIAFMMRHARGLVCVAMRGERLDALEIPLMVANNSESMKTAFTVSVDVIKGATTGISAADRAATIRALIATSTRPEDLARPGHIFPLRAHPDGVLGRPGHTEASVDLATLAGRAPCGVICEVANEDGTMARLPQLERFAAEHGLPLVSVGDLIEFRRHQNVVVDRISEAALPTDHGHFKMIAYRDRASGLEHVVLLKGDIRGQERALVRVHSECLTGEAFGSRRCDCGQQLHKALDEIEAAGAGCLIYLRGHEGRGIGLANKVAAYGLQDRGADTCDANTVLGFPEDAREYAAAAAILRDLGVASIILLTNNPSKIAMLMADDVRIEARQAIKIMPEADNSAYLKTKMEKMGHLLEVG